MKVYVVTNQALYHDSSYYDVVAVCKTRNDACAVVGTAMSDFIKGVERGEFLPDFKAERLDTCEDDMLIQDTKTCYFEQWNIKEMELPD